MAKAAKTQPKAGAKKAEKPAPMEAVASKYIRRLYDYLVAMEKFSRAYERYMRTRKTSLTEWATQLEATREKMKEETENIRPLVERVLGRPMVKETPAAEAPPQKQFNGAKYFNIIEREVMESIRLIREFKELEKKATTPFIFNESVEKTAISLVAVHESAEEELKRIYRKFM